MLELRSVTKRYSGIPAVQNVSFVARVGEVTGYLGLNGSGKSTTLKMITGLIEPSDGEILFRGQPVDRDPMAYRQMIGYVPEEPHLYPHLTGAEYLEMVGHLRGLPERQLDEKIAGFLRLLSLYQDRYVPISSYSKGMRQKVLLIAALLHNPELVLLDEPFSGLDVNSALVLRDLIRELAARGKVVVFSSHDLEIVERVCSCVVILRAFGAYWIAMYAAGLLVCCALLALQAIAANLLSYRLFLRLSSFLQLSAFFVILGVYFLKPPFAAGMRWLPSFWFLGLFQTLNGSREFDALAALAGRALYVVGPLALVAFSLAFSRYNRRIVEQPDIAPSDRSRPAMPVVGFFAAKLIPRPIERAVLLFTARTIARSRHHRLLLAAYGGIGLAVALAYTRDLLYGAHSFERLWRNPRWNQPNAPLLVGSFVLLFFAVMGARAVFSQPIALRANWIFRITAVQQPGNYFAAVRKPLLGLVVVPILLAWAALFLAIWPTGPAVRHMVLLAVSGFLMVQLSLFRFRKIPFACSYLPGKANLHVKLGLFAIGFLFITSQAIDLEFWSLHNPAAYAVLLAVLLAVSAWAYRRNLSFPDAGILFDEVAPNDIEALNLCDRGPRGGKPLELPPPEIPHARFSLEQFFCDLGTPRGPSPKLRASAPPSSR